MTVGACLAGGFCRSPPQRAKNRKVLPTTIEKGLPPGRPFSIVVGRQGFEPWLAESESAVLPLDDLPRVGNDIRILVLGRQGLTRAVLALALRVASRSKIAPDDFVTRAVLALALRVASRSKIAPDDFVEPWLAESESAVLPLDDLPNLPQLAAVQIRSINDYRFEYWVARRALRRPTFLRSTSRASRVTKPAFLSAGRSDSS